MAMRADLPQVRGSFPVTGLDAGPLSRRPTAEQVCPLAGLALKRLLSCLRRLLCALNQMDEIITGCDNPLFMGPTVRLDLTTILEATGELQHFLDLGAARLRAEGPLPEEASEALIFSMADELEDHLRAMRSRQGSANINDLRAWTRAWIDERQEVLMEGPLQGGNPG